MTRKRPDVQPCGERHERYLHCLTCNPVPPERPERLTGPEIGARVLFHSTYRGDRVGTVRERSYVWAPGDPAYHGGSRRYDVKVVDFDDGGSLAVDDRDLEAVPDYTEPPCIAGNHYPNDAGTACYYCGLPAETMTPDELAEAWGETLARQPVKGQTSWLD